MIQVVDLRKAYGRLKVLDGVTMECARGQITAILGESGGGKSTFMKMLIGAVTPDSGEIWIDGRNLLKLNERELDEVRRQIGVLFQHAALFQSMTVGENVALPILENTTLDANIVEIIVKMKLEQVGLSDFEEFMPQQLSGGMQKRVGLARAIALDPKLVLYDEPSAGLDPISAAVIDKLIADLNRVMGITSVVVTHDIRSALKIAHKVVMLHQGRVLIEGTPEALMASEDPLVQQFLNGDPDGPVQLRKSREDYERALLGK